MNNSSLPEMWAGIECTINRVRDEYHDQMQRNGHDTRVSDLDLFAQLGIRALRYPVLWECVAPDGLENIDWTWPEQRLGRLRNLNIRPIVGLVHHGSGPRHTSLIEPSFADGLAQYAGKVAERFPWIEDWTPVNEPLTTARFSGLYGHWYPHGRDEQTFARCLITQCRATAMAMQAVRRVNPAARLIQTDDLGKTYSTPRLQYQADFENERRWLSWDLLSGLVDRYHRMWGHLRWAGIEERDLHWFLDNPCPPDVLGVNHYLTSERYLDENVGRYPSQHHADNGRDRYADVEAVRVLAMGLPGIRGILNEAWQRYRRPLAVTEVHLGCTREEQMRWLLEVWNEACELRQSGVDVQAITVWALLGSYDWNSLLTRSEGHYEPGVYDLRGPAPRPTALAGMVREMAAGATPRNPVLAVPGWWRRTKRLLYAQPGVHPKMVGLVSPNAETKYPTAAKPILIAGANTALGYAFARLCDHRGLTVCALSSPELDTTDVTSIQASLQRVQPWAVIDANGLTDGEPFARDGEAESAVQSVDPALLAAVCAGWGLPFLAFSSEAVFDGGTPMPYVESDVAAPVSVAGHCQVETEARVRNACPTALIVRTSACYGPWDENNFLTVALRQLAAGEGPSLPTDVLLSPTYLPDLVHACLDLLLDGEQGLWHLVNPGAFTLSGFVRLAAERAGLGTERLAAAPQRGQASDGVQSLSRVLGSERGVLLPPGDKALDCYFQDCVTVWAGSSNREQVRLPGLHKQRRTAPLTPRVREERKGNRHPV